MCLKKKNELNEIKNNLMSLKHQRMTKKKIFALPMLCVFDKDTAQTHYCTVISM